MPITINTNVPSLTAQRNLNSTSLKLQDSLFRLSTGLRINRSSDDAAGLSISERMKAQLRSLAQAERNANDAISLLQVAEGAMNEMSGILTRMREIAIQSANGTYNSIECGYLDDEYQNMMDEIRRIAEVTQFSETPLLDGSLTSIMFQVGINATTNDEVGISFGDLRPSEMGTTTALTATDISERLNARDALAVIDEAIQDLSTHRGGIGAIQNRLQVSISNLGSARENLAAANSRIRDADMAHETAEMTKNSILMQAGTSVVAQANQLPALALSLLQLN
jgi:flagellin